MPEPPRFGQLQIDQDLAFQRRDWAVQRAGWVAVAVLLVGGLLGVFGQGPLAHARAGGSPGAPALEYDRFVRLGAPTRLVVTAPPDGEGPTELWLSRAYAESFTIERVLPEPARVAAEPGRLVYGIRRSGSGGAPVRVVFELVPQRAGRQRGLIGTGHAPPLRFTQLVYP